MIYTNVTNPKWANVEHTVIDCTVMSEAHGEIPFSAVASGDYDHTHEIFERCVAGEFGAIAEYTPPPEPTNEELGFDARFKRDIMLKSSDWTQLPDVPQTLKESWATYRQALRDITSQSGFPTNVVWPTKPN
jgi:hypothetical protein